MDLNERIARLLEPVPKWSHLYENPIAYSSRTSDGGAYYKHFVGHPHEYHVAIRFKESIDASMRVIEKRWGSPTVTLYDGTTPDEKCADLSVVESVNSHGAAATYAEALALALCAALEAEVAK